MLSKSGGRERKLGNLRFHHRDGESGIEPCPQAAAGEKIELHGAGQHGSLSRSGALSQTTIRLKGWGHFSSAFAPGRTMVSSHSTVPRAGTSRRSITSWTRLSFAYVAKKTHCSVHAANDR